MARICEGIGSSQLPRIPGGIALVYFMMLAPFVSVLNDVSTKMCGGNQQFVWSTDKRRSDALGVKKQRRKVQEPLTPASQLPKAVW